MVYMYHSFLTHPSALSVSDSDLCFCPPSWTISSVFRFILNERVEVRLACSSLPLLSLQGLSSAPPSFLKKALSGIWP